MNAPAFWAGLRRRDWLVPLALVVAVLTLGFRLDPHKPPHFDQALLDWIGASVQGLPQAALVQVYRLSGVNFTCFLVLGALLYLLLRRHWRDLALVAASTAGVLLIIDVLLKPLFERRRPAGSLLDLEGRSYPSGHAAGGLVFYAAMVTVLAARHPRWRLPLTLGASCWLALVWLSTLVVRAHWPTDLIGGGAIGTAWLMLCLTLWRRPERPSPGSVSCHRKVSP